MGEMISRRSALSEAWVITVYPLSLNGFVHLTLQRNAAKVFHTLNYAYQSSARETAVILRGAFE
jgi:hypothetical protein